MRRAVILVAFTALLGGCANRAAQSQPGWPLVRFDLPAAQAITALTTECMAFPGNIVVASTAGQVECARKSTNTFKQAVLGGSRSENPEDHWRVTVVSTGPTTSQGQVYAWFQLTMPNGQVTQQPNMEAAVESAKRGFIMRAGGKS